MSANGPNPTDARVLRDAALQVRPRLLVRNGADAAAAPTVQLLPFVPQHQRDAATRATELAQQLGSARADGVSEGLASAVDADRRAGYDEGLERGRRDSEQAIEQRLTAIANDSAAQAERFEALLAAFESQLDERLQACLREAEDDMVALCHAAICRILGEQAVPGATTRAVVRQAVGQWLERHRELASALTIHVHPRDLEHLQSDTTLGQILQAQRQRHITWQADPLLAMGGCIVSSERGRLDARLDTQMAALSAVLCEGSSAASTSEPET